MAETQGGGEAKRREPAVSCRNRRRVVGRHGRLIALPLPIQWVGMSQHWELGVRDPYSRRVQLGEQPRDFSGQLFDVEVDAPSGAAS